MARRRCARRFGRRRGVLFVMSGIVTVTTFSTSLHATMDPSEAAVAQEAAVGSAASGPTSQGDGAGQSALVSPEQAPVTTPSPDSTAVEGAEATGTSGSQAGSGADQSAPAESAAPASPSSSAAGSAAPVGGQESVAPASAALARPADSAGSADVSAAALAPGAWLSGASGTGAADGALGAWRGTPVEVAATWADNNEAMTQLSQLAPGGEYGSWDRPIDVALGGIGSGESWSKAAQGAYDGRWRQSLTKLRTLWGARSATVYIRFAHEMNANWYPWAVNAGNHQDFIAAWKRFRALQQEIFPSSQLVFCVNRESVGTSIDWRKTFPGAQYVDVMGVDYYNQYPYVASSADFASSLGQKDGYGAPKGLQQHLDFARSVGLPLSLPEWSGIGTNGDSPAFIEGMYNFFRANAGAGAGQLLYEVQFNVGMSGGRFQLYAGSQMPASAEAYRRLF